MTYLFHPKLHSKTSQTSKAFFAKLISGWMQLIIFVKSSILDFHWIKDNFCCNYILHILVSISPDTSRPIKEYLGELIEKHWYENYYYEINNNRNYRNKWQRRMRGMCIRVCNYTPYFQIGKGPISEQRLYLLYQN